MICQWRVTGGQFEILEDRSRSILDLQLYSVKYRNGSFSVTRQAFENLASIGFSASF